MMLVEKYCEAFASCLAVHISRRRRTHIHTTDDNIWIVKIKIEELLFALILQVIVCKSRLKSRFPSSAVPSVAPVFNFHSFTVLYV